MNTQRISQHWMGIGGARPQLVATFYCRLFERHPRFRPLFPEPIDHQMGKMLETLALVAEHADAPGAVHPRLRRIGAAHDRYGLTAADFDDFIEVLIETLSEYSAREWCEGCEQAWREALQRVVLPAVREGMH